MKPALYALNPQEHAAVLAALRHYQSDMAAGFDVSSVEAIASNSDTMVPLTASGIGILCDALNHTGLSMVEAAQVFAEHQEPEDDAPEYTCPKCGNHEFELDVTQTARVVFLEGKEHDVTEQPGGDIEWGGETPAQCHDCGWRGQLHEAKAEET